MNLVRAEAARLIARRFTQLMLMLLIAAFGVTVATTIGGSHQPTTVEIERAKAEAVQQQAEAERWYRECLRTSPEKPRDISGAPEPGCVRPEQNHFTDYLYGVFVFEQQIRPLVYFLIAFLALFGFLVGASYVGADLNSGGMTNLLLWRPQRMTVLGTKLGTLLAGTAVVSVVATVLYLGAFWVVAEVRGLPGDLDAEFWRWLTLTAGRGLVLVLMVTAVGFAIATLGRHTAAALGAVAAYAVVWEAGARIVMAIVETPRPDQWMLSSHLAAWLAGGASFWDPGPCRGNLPSDFTGSCDGSYTITSVTGIVVLLTVTGVCLAAAFVNFRRRDLA